MTHSNGPPRAANFSGNLFFSAGTSAQLGGLGNSYIDDGANTLVLGVATLNGDGFAATVTGAA